MENNSIIGRKTRILNKNDIKPAYACKSSKTGLLNISTIFPPHKTNFQVVSSSTEDCTSLHVVPALYPIAVNGDGVGIYNDPQPVSGVTSTSIHNQVGRSHIPKRSFVEQPWNMDLISCRSKNKECVNNYDNNKQNEAHQSVEGKLDCSDMSLDTLYNEIDNSHEQENIIKNIRELFMSPWKTWEKVLGYILRLTKKSIISGVHGIGSISRLLSLQLPVLIPPKLKNKTRFSNLCNEDDFDFVLVLQHREVYAFWAELLDFRSENGIIDECFNTKQRSKILPNDIRGSMDNPIDSMPFPFSQNTNPISATKNPGESNNLTSKLERKTNIDVLNKRILSEKACDRISTRECISESITNRTCEAFVDIPGQKGLIQTQNLFDRAMCTITPSSSNNDEKYSWKLEVEKKSRKIYSSERHFTDTSQNNMNYYQSPSSRSHISLNFQCSSHITKEKSLSESYPFTAQKRRWGSTMLESHDIPRNTKPNLMSPPVRSCKDRNRTKYSSREYMIHSDQKNVSNKNNTDNHSNNSGMNLHNSPNLIVSETNFSEKSEKKSIGYEYLNSNKTDIEYIPSQVVPRGISARTNGMEEFLSAIKRGFVVRRHRESGQSAFVKILSLDGGDTIQYNYLSTYEAMISLKEQNIRYNRNVHDGYAVTHSKSVLMKSAAKRWSGSNSNTLTAEEEKQIHNFTLPDYVAAEKYRDSRSRYSGWLRRFVSDMTNRAAHSGVLKATDVVAVHPASHPNPFSVDDDFGTSTLRDSPAEYYESLTFSLVLSSGIGSAGSWSSLKSMNEKWHAGVGSERAFKFLNIETATEGEYWMIFRGFLLLHRDALSGRFAAQRTCGFSSNYNRRELKQRMEDMKRVQSGDLKTQNDFLEPEENSCLLKIISQVLSRIWKNNKSQSIFKIPTPPPSEFFLGFKSPGTQIWGRLRQAGLETQRIYALDSRRVMIKVRCPYDRLMDVAEVLKIKLKTKDGYFSPFRERSKNRFISSNSEVGITGTKDSTESLLFRSSERQQIIDFIIRSRIRDSGAELGERNDLGKDIIMRVPIHMHARLDALYNCWVLYYRNVNWVNRSSDKNICVERKKINQRSSLSSAFSFHHNCYESHHIHKKRPASTFTRFILGSFYQPLDSVEQYFGERVAFYFAWLQHCSLHLVLPSVFGLVVFLCQICSGNFDHPVRPYFATFVMIWSFVVIVNWQKRQNFLAHRWGTMNYKEEETTRPQYHGVYRRCEITNEWVIQYPSWKRWIKYSISLPLTVAYTVVSLIGILLVYANRDIALARYFSTKQESNNMFAFDWNLNVIGKREPIGAVNLSKAHLGDPIFWCIIAGFPAIIGLVLPLLNYLLMKISVALNDFENYRTETQYRNALIVKVFACRFVTYFAALYYYAYIAIGTDKVIIENGILRVATSLFIYLTVSHWWSIFLIIQAPSIWHRWRLYRQKSKLKSKTRTLERMELEISKNKYITVNEKRDGMKKLINKRLLLEHAQNNIWVEIMLPSYDPFFDYIQAVIQFTYVVCFSAMFPVTPLFVLLNNLMNMRLNAYKICRGRRRPLSQKTGGIGVWEHVLHIVTVLAVLTNCSLMVLTSSQFRLISDKLGNIGLFSIVVVWEHVMLLIKYFFQSSSSKYPKSVLDSLKKESYRITRKRNSSMRAKKERRSSHYPAPWKQVSNSHFSSNSKSLNR